MRAVPVRFSQKRKSFVGTKKQAQDAIAAEAERCGMFYVNERWLGGMLTNFKTIQGRIGRLKQIETMQEDGTFDVLPKKEVIALKKEMEKLQKNLGGIKEIKMADAVVEARQGEAEEADAYDAEGEYMDETPAEE